MLYAQLKPRIDQALHRPATWWATLVGLTLVYVIMHHLIGVDKWGIVSCLFCLMIVVGTMKVQIGNPVLKWVGIHAFAIYILQRLPMNLLSDWGISPQTAVFVPCAIIATFLLAAGFTWATDHIDKKLFGHA
jgi:peptidoglycan/LPS O-acetylase OafA/YrhL